VDPWTVRAALEAGATGCLLKSNAASRLQSAIGQVLKGHRFLCEDSAAALQQAESSDSRTGPAPGPAILSRRETEVLKCLAYGQTTKAIALQLAVSPKTVETHRSHILQKLRLNNVAALTRYAIQHGLTPV
jgi:two-component system, NarL family, response regulator NreC